MAISTRAYVLTKYFTSTYLCDICIAQSCIRIFAWKSEEILNWILPLGFLNWNVLFLLLFHINMTLNDS